MNQKMKMLIPIIFVIGCQSVFANKNAVYYEFLGNSFGNLDLNYDRIVYSNERGLAASGRIGIAYYLSKSDLSPVMLPTMAQLLMGKKRHKLETGIGVIHSFTFRYNLSSGGKEFDKYLPRMAALIGYRNQKDQMGFMWRIGFTPTWSVKDKFFIPLFGVSAGFTF
jgi:hypothetical protein